MLGQRPIERSDTSIGNIDASIFLSSHSILVAKLPGFTPLKHTPTPLGVKFHAEFQFCDCEINLYSLLQIKAQINIHFML